MADSTTRTINGRALVLLGALLAALALALAPLAAAAQADATSAVPPALALKADWKVTGAWCPVGCSSSQQGLLEHQLGQAVQLSESRLTAAFIDACGGQVHLRLQPTPVARIVDSVNLGLPPDQRRLTAADLGESGAPLSGWALCKDDKADLNMKRLLVVTPDRVLLLGEEQSLVELR